MQAQTDSGFAAALAALLTSRDADGYFESDGVVRATPYDELGILTSNAGLVVRMDDGSEFQVTVVRSRGPRS